MRQIIRSVALLSICCLLSHAWELEKARSNESSSNYNSVILKNDKVQVKIICTDIKQFKRDSRDQYEQNEYIPNKPNLMLSFKSYFGNLNNKHLAREFKFNGLDKYSPSYKDIKSDKFLTIITENSPVNPNKESSIEILESWSAECVEYAYNNCIAADETKKRDNDCFFNINITEIPGKFSGDFEDLDIDNQKMKHFIKTNVQLI